MTPSRTPISSPRCAACAPIWSASAGTPRTIRGRLRGAAAEHLTIVQAIIAHDPELAAHATHVHLHRALRNALATSTSTPSSDTDRTRAPA